MIPHQRPIFWIVSLAALERVFRALADHRVRVLLTGGYAVAVHGHGRATHDKIRVLTELDPSA